MDINTFTKCSVSFVILFNSLLHKVIFSFFIIFFLNEQNSFQEYPLYKVFAMLFYSSNEESVETHFHHYNGLAGKANVIR